jgi:hypothetical protein
MVGAYDLNGSKKCGYENVSKPDGRREVGRPRMKWLEYTMTYKN